MVVGGPVGDTGPGRWRPTFCGAEGGQAAPGRANDVANLGRSLEEAIEVRSPGEEYDWLEWHPCLCGGRWELECQRLLKSERNDAGSRMTDKLGVACDTCGRKGEFYFVVQYEGKLGGDPPETPS